MKNKDVEQLPNELPLGELVENPQSTQPPGRKLYNGWYVNLAPVDPKKDTAELYRNSHGSEEKARLWIYMAYGPFSDDMAMKDWLMDCKLSSDPLFLTVRSKDLTQCVGVVSFLNIVPRMRTLELGNIWYSPVVHRTKINTETIYLMLSEAFDALKYRRVEWKCDALNARSRAAALQTRLQLRRYFQTALYYQRPQPGYRLVCHAGPRLACSQRAVWNNGCIRRTTNYH